MLEDRTHKPSDDEIARGRAWFHWYMDMLDRQPAQLPLRCPCCFCKTLGGRACFEVCEVCYWEDDGQDEYDADVVRGGPNGELSLTQARANYRRFGACDEQSLPNVRPPKADELPGGEAR
jgi:hypothetical protein